MHNADIKDHHQYNLEDYLENIKIILLLLVFVKISAAYTVWSIEASKSTKSIAEILGRSNDTCSITWLSFFNVYYKKINKFA